MEGIIIASAIVGWFAILFFSFNSYIEKESVPMGIVGLIVLIGGFAFVIQDKINGKRSGPCISSEIQMHFNPSIKTVMPVEVCTNRGKWVRP